MQLPYDLVLQVQEHATQYDLGRSLADRVGCGFMRRVTSKRDHHRVGSGYELALATVLVCRVASILCPVSRVLANSLPPILFWLAVWLD